MEMIDEMTREYFFEQTGLYRFQNRFELRGKRFEEQKP